MKMRHVNKNRKYGGYPYKDYTIGISHAGRAALDAEISDLDLRYSQARGDTHDGECTAADFILEIAMKQYREYGTPKVPAGYFDFTLNSGVRLTLLIDQSDRLLACWVASEADDDRVPAVHIDPCNCSADFIERYGPQTLH
jgi:hypothetical protein